MENNYTNEMTKAKLLIDKIIKQKCEQGAETVETIRELMEMDSYAVFGILYSAVKGLLLEKTKVYLYQSDAAKNFTVYALVDLMKSITYTTMHMYDGSLDIDAEKLIILMELMEGSGCLSS